MEITQCQSKGSRSDGIFLFFLLGKLNTATASPLRDQRMNTNSHRPRLTALGWMHERSVHPKLCYLSSSARSCVRTRGMSKTLKQYRMFTFLINSTERRAECLFDRTVLPFQLSYQTFPVGLRSGQRGFQLSGPVFLKTCLKTPKAYF